MARVLYRVSSLAHARVPFVAGLVADEHGIIVKTAPILKRYLGTHVDHLRADGKEYGWTVEQREEQRRGAGAQRKRKQKAPPKRG
jgi:hypothetical protein